MASTLKNYQSRTLKIATHSQNYVEDQGLDLIRRHCEKNQKNLEQIILGQGWNVGLKFKPRTAKDLSETKDSTYQSYKLLQRLIKENVKEYKCVVIVNGCKIPLHHIDGEHTNNELSNLQILCPNCHAQTDNYAGKKNQIVESNPNHKKVSSI